MFSARQTLLDLSRAATTPTVKLKLLVQLTVVEL
jgi:hypothetical protein